MFELVADAAAVHSNGAPCCAAACAAALRHRFCLVRYGAAFMWAEGMGGDGKERYL